MLFFLLHVFINFSIDPADGGPPLTTCGRDAVTGQPRSDAASCVISEIMGAHALAVCTPIICHA